MIHVRVPGRVNLIGDHTDYTGGLVLPMAIDRFTTIDGEIADTRVHLVSTSETDAVEFSVDDDFTPHMVPSWGRYVAAVASEMIDAHGIVGVVDSTIPIGAGLSSSASLEIACALAMGADMSPVDLALMTQRAEQKATGVPTGIMDQLCIASAREGHGALIDCHSLQVSHVPIPDEVDVVVQFIAHRTLVGSEYGQRVSECERAEQLIGPLRTATADDVTRIADELIRKRARHVVSENQRVRDFSRALAQGDYAAAGRLMVQSHHSLATDYDTSTAQMDAAVATACDTPGVFGARMTGGGFGGCIVALTTTDSPLSGWRVRPAAGPTVD